MRYGLVKASVDAHTLGLASIAGLLQEAGAQVSIAPAAVCAAVQDVRSEDAYGTVRSWIRAEGVTFLGLSYRLDPQAAFETFDRLVDRLDEDHELGPVGSGTLRGLAFAGLPEAGQRVLARHGRRFVVFSGDEDAAESLELLGVPSNRMPSWLIEDSRYDRQRMRWATQHVQNSNWEDEPPPARHGGSATDTLARRIQRVDTQHSGDPLLRFHVGPYSPDRREAIALANDWLRQLDTGGHVDIVSLGTSQLSQERFDLQWGDRANGGGVPVASPAEFSALKASAGKMLVRAYSGTREVADYAKMLEHTIDNAWHALSFWWFNQLDGRGPLSVHDSLTQHLDAIRVAAAAGKPFEPNIAHHFAFRGGDDVTGIVAVVLAVEAAIAAGIRTVVLQTMLNTPRMTSGIADIAKVRALLSLLRPHTQRGIKIILQPRAGLSYFSSDLDKARAQLAASTALMSDLVQGRNDTPRIIHVVSYTEATALADPPVIEDSARLVRSSLRAYRTEAVGRDLLDASTLEAIVRRQNHLVEESRLILRHARVHVGHLGTPEGLHEVFRRGYLAVPDLWQCRDAYPRATAWRTKVVRGAVDLVDAHGSSISAKERLTAVECPQP